MTGVTLSELFVTYRLFPHLLAVLGDRRRRWGRVIIALMSVYFTTFWFHKAGVCIVGCWPGVVATLRQVVRLHDLYVLRYVSVRLELAANVVCICVWMILQEVGRMLLIWHRSYLTVVAAVMS